MIKMIENYITEEDKLLLGELKNVILLILTVIDLIFIFCSTLYTFNFKVEHLFADYDFIVCLLLFIDLFYEFYTTDRTIKEFFIDDKNIISLLSLMPFDLLLRYFSIFRLFKFFKILKMVRVWHVAKDLHSLNYFIHNHLYKLLLIILLIYTTISSIFLYALEDSIRSFEEALWFNLVTAATVGYGDITPVTPTGRALSTLTILIGIITVAILTAYLTSIYNENRDKELQKSFKSSARVAEENNRLLNRQLELIEKKINHVEEENRELKRLIREYIREKEK